MRNVVLLGTSLIGLVTGSAAGQTVSAPPAADAPTPPVQQAEDPLWRLGA